MPYDERTVKELRDSADITPMGIQLEVNAEIFTTVNNLLSSTQSLSDRLIQDQKRLYALWRKTIHELAAVETRTGWGLSMEDQLSMLKEAFSIETAYVKDQIFLPASVPSANPHIQENDTDFADSVMNELFREKVWPSVCSSKTGSLRNPVAYLVAGQPGSGKTRMSSVLIETHRGDIIQAMDDNFRGFHPSHHELAEKHGRCCAYYTLPMARLMSRLTARYAAQHHYNLIIEGSLENPENTMKTIEFLKGLDYRVIVMLRACPQRISWKAIHQFYIQQRLKAPGLSRLITKEYHDRACRGFLTAVNDIVKQNLIDQMIIKSPKGLLYDSDDMPTERVSDVLSARMIR
ncbi:MAG TPA: toxin [Veillonellaceae bacterium]|jgi:hypothetical protein|nr:toxin [Veillonellaceae bacterium]